MRQRILNSAWIIAFLLGLMSGCGQGSLMKESSTSSDNRKSSSSGEDTAADSPQSIAGAYLTSSLNCEEYENIVSPQGKVVSTRCKVLDKNNKRVPMSLFPNRKWGFSDKSGKEIPADAVQITEKKDDPAADVEIAVTLTDPTVIPVVDFWFDKNDQSKRISQTIQIKGASAAEILRVLGKIKGTWDIYQGCKDENLAMTKLGVIEVKVTGTDASSGQQVPLVEAWVRDDGTGKGLKDGKGNTVPPNTLMFKGKVYYSAYPPYIDLTVERNAIVKEPDPNNSPRLKFKESAAKLEMEMKEKVPLGMTGSGRTTQWEMINTGANLTR